MDSNDSLAEQEKYTGWMRAVLGCVLFFVFLVFISLFFPLFSDLIFGEGFSENVHSSKVGAAQKLFEFICMIVFLYWLMRQFDRKKFIALGFHWKGRSTDLFCGLFVGSAAIILGYVILLFLGEIEFQKVVVNGPDILLMFVISICVALTEEMIFRGYILRNLLQSFGPYLALFASSLIFAVFHGLNPNLDLLAAVSIFLGGVFIGLSYVYTQNLWFPVGLHFSWNFAQAFLGFNVSGENYYSVVEFSIVNNNKLNGGEFGYESSILATIFMSIIIFSVWAFYRSQNIPSRTTSV